MRATRPRRISDVAARHETVAARSKTEILYRKWRPRTFAELAGQEHVATTLINALASSRVAHAYLFAGPRGTGKTSTGRLLGKALNCSDRQGGEPCNRCESCLSFLAGRAMDLIELDAASNRGIDEIRSLRDKVAFAPAAGEFKVYLIDEVHMLTEAAFNALLKTLEEPPPHVVFILATTEAHKVPATIASRCQRFDFKRIPLVAAVETLQRICAAEAIACEAAALEMIARWATGSLRDSINLLDQLATSYGSDLTVEHVKAGLGLIGDERTGRLARLVLGGDLAGGLELIASVRDDGLDLRQFQRELVEELRNLLLMKSGIEPAEGLTVERGRELAETVAGVPTAGLLTALRAFGEADLRADPNSTLPLDIALAECILGREPTGGQAATAAHPEPASPVSKGDSPGREPGRRVEGRAVAPRPAPAETQARPVVPPGTEASAAHPEPASPVSKGDSPGREPGRRVEGRAGVVVAPTLAALRSQMRLIYERARSRRPQLGALLNSGCDIIEVEEGEVRFGFKFPNHADKASEKPNLDALRAIVSELTNQDMVVTCSSEEGVMDWKQRETTSRSPLVRAAQEMGALVLSSEPEV